MSLLPQSQTRQPRESSEAQDEGQARSNEGQLSPPSSLPLAVDLDVTSGLGLVVGFAARRGIVLLSVNPVQIESRFDIVQSAHSNRLSGNHFRRR